MHESKPAAESSNLKPAWDQVHNRKILSFGAGMEKQHLGEINCLSTIFQAYSWW